jgi:hypothetical protein
MLTLMGQLIPMMPPTLWYSRILLVTLSVLEAWQKESKFEAKQVEVRLSQPGVVKQS